MKSRDRRSKGASATSQETTSSDHREWHVASICSQLVTEIPSLPMADGSGVVVFTPSRSHLYGIPSRERKITHVHPGRIIAARINPHNTSEMYVCCKGGQLALWPIDGAKPTQTWELGEGMKTFALDPVTPYRVYIAHGRKPLTTNYVFSCVDLQSMHSQQLWKAGSQSVADLFTSASGAYICATFKNASFCHIYHVQHRLLKRLSHSKNIECAAFHPHDAFFAFGDRVGRLCLDYNVLNKDHPDKSNSAATKLHWHTESVVTLAFSGDGNHIYTGGLEQTVVMWRHDTGEKTFFPHWEADIMKITVAHNTQTLCVNCGDSSVRIVSAVSAHHRPVRIETLKGHSETWRLAAQMTGLVLEGSRGWMVQNGASGQLQFYDVVQDCHIANLRIARASQANIYHGKRIPPTLISRILFSPKADHLITVHLAHSPVMKFWHYHAAEHTYTANTEVDMGMKKQVTGVAYHPHQNIVASCGSDSYFKIWDLDAKKGTWRCKSIGCYRSASALAIAFSSDGSLLAVVYGNEVTFWEVATNTLVHIWACEKPGVPLLGISFLPGTAFVLAYSTNSVYLYNVMNASLWWSCQLPVHHVAVDKFSTGSAAQFAVASGKQITLFACNSPSPTAFWTVKSKIVGISFRGCASDPLALIVLVQNHEIIRLEYSAREQKEETTAPSHALHEPAEPLRNSIVAKKSVEQPVLHNTVSTRDVFNGPSHIMPTPATLYQSFMSRILAPATQPSVMAPSPEEENKSSLTVLEPMNVSPTTRTEPDSMLRTEFKDGGYAVGTGYSAFSELFENRTQ